jgi:hypothetical protein
MSRDRERLRKLLSVVVEEWGYAEVRNALAEVLKDRRGKRYGTVAGKPSSGNLFAQATQKGSKKPTAVQQVMRSAVAEQERERLMPIAAKFDRKEFLPRVGDIKHFLAMVGEPTEAIKNREEGFRRILRKLMQLSPDRLDRILSTASYSGPSELRPLSEAIKSAGATLRRTPGPEEE